MTGYTSGKFSHDPKPYVDRTGFRWTPPTYGFQAHHTLTYSPRPEFDNHNPILVHMRMIKQSPLGQMKSWRTDAFASSLLESLSHGWRPTEMRLTAEQIDHARRVLTKLESLTKEES